MSQWNAKQQRSPGPRAGQDRQAGTPGRGGGGGGGGKELKASFTVARELIHAGRHDEALKKFEAILERNPSAVQAYLGIGNVHAARGRFDDALEHLAAALHIKKDYVPALMLSGKILARQKLHDKALEKFKEALEIKPALSKASLGVAHIYSKLGRQKEALDCLKSALEHNPQLDEARLALAGLYQRAGDRQAAMAEVTAVIRHNPNSWQGHFHYANLLCSQGEFGQAIGASKRAIELNPESAALHHLLGRAYLGSREFDLAQKQFNRALELDTSLMNAKIGLVRVHIETGALADAKSRLVEMSKGARNLMLVHRLLADVAMREGRYADAVAEFKAAALHSSKRAEKFPGVLAIQPVVGDDRKTAELYQKAFAQIEEESSLSVVPLEDSKLAFTEDSSTVE